MSFRHAAALAILSSILVSVFVINAAQNAHAQPTATSPPAVSNPVLNRPITEKHQSFGRKASHAMDLGTPSEIALNFFTGLLVLVGFIQAWILRSTLTVSRASQRAYVLARCEKAGGISIGDRPRVVVVLKNFGTTPAYRLRHHAQISFAEYPAPENFKLRELKEPKSIEMSITPQIEYGFPVFVSTPLTREEVDEIELHHGKMLVYGTVRYRTLGMWRYTNFAFFYLGENLFIMASVGNDSN